MIWIVVALAALWILTLFIGFVLIGALRTLGVLNWRLDNLSAIIPSRVGRAGLKVGRKAPDFTLPDLKGQTISLGSFIGKKLLLVFMQPGCGPCNRLVGELNRFHETQPISLLIIQKGTREEVRKWAEGKGARFAVLLQEKDEISRKYEMFATPFAFLISEQGLIESKGIINDGKQIQFVISGRRATEGPGQTDKEDSESQEGLTQVAQANVS